MRSYMSMASRQLREHANSTGMGQQLVKNAAQKHVRISVDGFAKVEVEVRERDPIVGYCLLRDPIDYGRSNFSNKKSVSLGASKQPHEHDERFPCAGFKDMSGNSIKSEYKYAAPFPWHHSNFPFGLSGAIHSINFLRLKIH